MSQTQNISAAVIPSKRLGDFARAAQFDINEAGRHLLDTGSLSLGRSFNAAVRVPGADRFVLGGFTSRGKDPAAAIVVGFDGTLYEGVENANLREIVGVYAALFAARPDLNAALHTHSPRITAFAVAQRPLPIIYGPLLRRTHGEIPLAAWSPRYAAEPVLETLRQHPEAPAVLLANRGLLAWSGDGIEKLAAFVASLEESAAIAIRAELLGGAKPFPPGAFEAAQRSPVVE